MLSDPVEVEGADELESARKKGRLTMALTNAYVQIYGQLKDVFQSISEGQAPEKFTRQHLKDIGFGGSNYRAVIPLLKAIGFLSEDGTPTKRYHDYRNQALARRVMAEALRDGYSDLFTIKSSPSPTDRDLIEGKFKSTFNATPLTAKLMASTFFALLALADLSEPPVAKKEEIVEVPTPKIEKTEKTEKREDGAVTLQNRTSLHYNIQIHLPATKDIEVFNAIFKAIKEHLLE